MATQTLLEATIERRLEQNNPKKRARLHKAGTLRKWLKQQAGLATDAMNSLGPEANDDQRREMASEYLNPLTPEQEHERSETEAEQESVPA